MAFSGARLLLILAGGIVGGDSDTSTPKGQNPTSEKCHATRTSGIWLLLLLGDIRGYSSQAWISVCYDNDDGSLTGVFK